MKINSLKEFKALVKACRALGVSAMEVGEIKFNLGPIPKMSTTIPNKDIDKPTLEESVAVPLYNGPMSEVEVPDTEMLTEEQLLNWSSQGPHELEQ